jgi:hypothetical protein
MKHATVAVVALVSLSSAACTQTGSAQTGTDSWRAEIESADSGESPAATDYVRNANDCAPTQSRAVWGPHQVFLGYACYTNPNGY